MIFCLRKQGRALWSPIPRIPITATRAAVSRHSESRISEIPFYGPGWLIQLSANNRRVLSGEVPFNARERCWPAGVPGFEVFTLLRPSDAGNAHPSATTAEDAPRFKPTEGSKMLEVSITVDDPGAFNTVWSGIQIYRMEFQGNWDETICAENNDIPHFRYENDAVRIPQAKRPDF